MKIAVLTSGILPVPAVQGGAVENLTDCYLAWNHIHRLHDITVYSVFHPQVCQAKELQSETNHYIYIDTSSWRQRLRRYLFGRLQHGLFYNHYIEFFLSEAIKKMGNEHYDLIILENRPGYALHKELVTHGPLVLHLHNDFLNDSFSLAEKMAVNIDKIIVVSDYIKQRVSTVSSSPETCVVYNGIDPNRFIKATNKTALREQLDIPGQDFIVLYTGRLMREKGIDKLLEAFMLLQEEPNIKLYILGNSYFNNVNHDNEFTLHLKEMAVTLGSKVKFTGYIPYDQVPQYVAAADVAVVPSTWQEPFGLTCIEAMAAGIPLITTKVGGIPEIVKGKQNFLLDADDNLPHNLANAIITVKRNYRQFSGNTLDPRFTAENYAKAFFQALPQPK